MEKLVCFLNSLHFVRYFEAERETKLFCGGFLRIEPIETEKYASYPIDS